MATFSASGKILLTSEFLILHGAKALAIPLIPGQTLETIPSGNRGKLSWSARHQGKEWFSATFQIPGSTDQVGDSDGTFQLEIFETSDRGKAENLAMMLHKLVQLKPGFATLLNQFDVVTNLEFDPQFGFGSSSTLTALLANWADVDPLQYHFSFSRGSGYDVACANADSAILYRVIEEMPVVQQVQFAPPFLDQLYLVYRGSKQGTTESVSRFLNNYTPTKEDVDYFSEITAEFLHCQELEEFGDLMADHEKRLANILGIPPVKETHFPDLDGWVKSLGAWGGDFVLVATAQDRDAFSSYLTRKGYPTWFTFNEITR